MLNFMEKDLLNKLQNTSVPYVRNALLAGFVAGTIFIAANKIKEIYLDFSGEKIENIKEMESAWHGERRAPKSLETHVGGRYQTIQYTNNIPAIIVESFFGTNKEDLKYFSVKENREYFCNHVVKGIEGYVNSNSNIKKITIAGGHGENDPGALFGDNHNIKESNFNKEMSKYISDKLKEKGYSVQYLWYQGSGGQIERLNYYTDKANKYSGKSVYVEIHANAAKPSVAGSRIYGPKPKSENPKSHKFGKMVLNEVNKSW